IGRALQGAGAVGAAVKALLADLTRDSVRTKGMALIGVSIGLMFALSLVLAPPLAAVAGLPGIFGLTFVLTLLGALAVWRWTPPEPDRSLHPQESGGLVAVLKHPQLWRLNIGVFTLHAVQLAMWMAVPAMLTQAGLAPAAHWQVYLPTVLGGFLLTGGLFALERRGHLRSVLRGAVALLLLVQCGLFWSASSDARIAPLVVWLFLFFLVFNVLEASQPSLVSRLAPASARGAAMGLYNTLQSVGFFVGGALGGVAVKYAGSQGLFILCAGMALV
ncbi:MAG: MFS transporter, partial [Burkholderiaceae bacterium]